MGMSRFPAPALGIVLAALLAVPAHADLTGYDGSNPFGCELQQAGFGAEFPDPGADPFCVEYDKTRQNVTQLGVVEFLSREPARVAAASPKCFYFQRDHWRGSVVQEDDTTETYSWDGSYFFDKARGIGGAYVENFTVNNQTGDPTALPGFPDGYRPFFGPGRGGVQATDTVRADPRCLDRPLEEEPQAGAASCPERRGSVGRGIGGARIGMTRAELERTLGAAPRRLRGFMRYCLADGGKLAAALSRDRVRFVLTTSPGFAYRGVAPGDGERGARRALRGERVLMRRGRSTVLALRMRGRRTLIAGISGNRVSYLAVAARDVSRAGIGRYLTRSR